MGFYRPHIPLWAPKQYFDRFEGRDITLPPHTGSDLDDLGETARRWALEAVTAGSHATVVKHKQWGEAVKAYLACTTFVDTQIGRLLDALDQSPHADNTMIVLWSDHGWHLGEKEHWGKWTGWERSTRVPLIIVPPKQADADFPSLGRQCSEPVSLIDLYPTLCELCDVPASDSLDGQSLVPLLRDPSLQTDRVILTSFDPGNVSLRSDQWRYIRYSDGSQELYDLRSDPNEWTNLVEDPTHHELLQSFQNQVPAEALRP
jgi:arylsulfatase A-like enzyme